MSETWNYDDSDPVKYEMKNSDGHVLSVMKETVSGDSEYRQEHIFYDSEGHTKRSFVASYDGADIKWFTYYDAEAPYKNITIEYTSIDWHRKTKKLKDYNAVIIQHEIDHLNGILFIDKLEKDYKEPKNKKNK